VYEDEAFYNIAKGIRKVVNDLNGKKEADIKETTEAQEKRTKSGESGKRDTIRTPQSIDDAFLKKVANQYCTERKDHQKVANREWGLQVAFQNMLASVAKHIGWSEMKLGKVHVSGVVQDTFHIPRGYWEAKGPETNLEKEIAKKIADKRPLNIIFEDSHTAILYQNKKGFPVEFKLHTPKDVSDLLHHFFTYVEPEIKIFEDAVDEFKEQIPEQANVLSIALAIVRHWNG
jgi:hypothetical protein